MLNPADITSERLCLAFHEITSQTIDDRKAKIAESFLTSLLYEEENMEDFARLVSDLLKFNPPCAGDFCYCNRIKLFALSALLGVLISEQVQELKEMPR